MISPELSMQSVTVEAPASSANLGPGFDSMAVALDRYLRVTVTPLDHGAESLVVEGEGADEIGLDAGNRFLIGLERGLQQFRLEPPVMRIEMRNEIPLARGLGSSAAAAVCGLLVAEALAGQTLGASRLLELATDIESHPDNAAASLQGGVVIVGRAADGGPLSARLDPPDWLMTALFVPDRPLRTAEMRGALPETVTHRDAAHNVSRAALVVAALTADRPELLRAMSEDRLHEQYRARHFSELPTLVEAAMTAGARGASLSGAGSTVIALCDDPQAARAAAQAMADTAERLGVPGRSRVVRPVATGARILHD